MNRSDVVIVGAGHGGAQCAISLRQNGFSGTITVIGREPEYPYERPPLSKEYLAGKKDFERLYIRPPSFWTEKDVMFTLGTEVIGVDSATKTLMLSSGEQHGYGKLVWATGGDPRRVSCPGSDLAGIHTVRTREDCDLLIAEIRVGIRRVVVIGGGYIGLEAAAALTIMGLEVTLMEALPRVLSRVAGAEISEFYENEHRSNGVDLRTNARVEALLGADRVSGVRMASGEVIPADAVIVGIGIMPAVDPLLRAGATGGDGVNVDEYCRTSLVDIYAIGDCAAFVSDHADGIAMRIESVQNASDMARCVAKTICGSEQPYRALPWFWSNQYDLKLQTAGINTGYDKTVLRGALGQRRFSVIYLKQGRVVAIDCVNMIKDYVQAGALIEAGVAPDLERLRDAEQPLKTLLQ